MEPGEAKLALVFGDEYGAEGLVCTSLTRGKGGLAPACAPAPL